MGRGSFWQCSHRSQNVLTAEMAPHPGLPPRASWESIRPWLGAGEKQHLGIQALLGAPQLLGKQLGAQQGRGSALQGLHTPCVVPKGPGVTHKSPTTSTASDQEMSQSCQTLTETRGYLKGGNGNLGKDCTAPKGLGKSPGSCWHCWVMCPGPQNQAVAEGGAAPKGFPALPSGLSP